MSKLRLSFNQPAFIPWGGFFARLHHSDLMVLLDDTLLARGFTYVNRNRLKGPQGEVWITVPLRRKDRGRQRIRHLEIHEPERWGRLFTMTLHHLYAHSPAWDPVGEEVSGAVRGAGPGFLDLCTGLMSIPKRHLGIATPIRLQSEIAVAGQGDSLLVSIALKLGATEIILPYFARNTVDWHRFLMHGIGVLFLRYDPPAYPQFWGPFLKRLSILDLILCCADKSGMVLESGTHIYTAHEIDSRRG